jgi:hypothetical protein
VVLRPRLVPLDTVEVDARLCYYQRLRNCKIAINLLVDGDCYFSLMCGSKQPIPDVALSWEILMQLMYGFL